MENAKIIVPVIECCILPESAEFFEKRYLQLKHFRCLAELILNIIYFL